MIHIITIMICTATSGELIPVEVPGEPLVTRTEYVFTELGIRFDRKQCFIDHTEVEDAVQ